MQGLSNKGLEPLVVDTPELGAWTSRCGYFRAGGLDLLLWILSNKGLKPLVLEALPDHFARASDPVEAKR